MNLIKANFPSVHKWRKKPVIEAALYTGNNLAELIEWSDDNLDNKARVNTLEGTMKLNVGSYLAKGVKGEFYPIDPEIMKLTYEKI